MEQVEEAPRLILWGWGMIYNRQLDRLRRFCADGEIRIDAVTGTVPPPYAVLDGIEVICPEQIPTREYDYILVFSERSEKEIIARAMDLPGVTRDRFLTWRMLELPDFSFRDYFRLRKARVSIVSNHCWGGMACHLLGLEIRSPFTNLWIGEDPYLDLLGDLRRRCTEETPVFRCMRPGEDGKPYPVLALGDTELNCTHAQSPQQALEDWNRRVVRINWDDLLVALYTEDRRREERFAALERYPHKVCFVPYETDLPDSVRIPIVRPGMPFSQAVLSTVMLSNHNFSYSLLRLMLGIVPWKRGQGRRTEGQAQ